MLIGGADWNGGRTDKRGSRRSLAWTGTLDGQDGHKGRDHHVHIPSIPSMLVYLLVRSSACARRRSFLTWWAVEVVEGGGREEGGTGVKEEQMA